MEFLEFNLPVTVRSGFCWVTTMVPTKKRGYIQLSYKGANKFCTLGEMLGWVKGMVTTRGQAEISHLCHNPLCTIPAHVVLESPVENNARKGCKSWVDCPHCSSKIRVCDHQPMCIRHVEGYEA